MTNETNPLMDIVVTTYPEAKSRNVGDHLISRSFIELIRNRNPDFAPEFVFREKSLTGFSRRKVRSVIAPGFSVADNTYPELFTLYEDLGRLDHFYPVGCSFQYPEFSNTVFETAPYGDATIDFLKRVVAISGPLPCRDGMIVERLERYDIPAIYSGDLAIYDETRLFQPFTPPKEIKSVVFTIGHHVRYLHQALTLMKMISAKFPDAKKYVAIHSRPGFMPQSQATWAELNGFEVLSLFGDSQALEIYDDIDLHIGYRLHGHIAFLRNRKPSMLMVEDVRSLGMSMTEGTGTGTVLSFDGTTGEVRDTAPAELMEMLDGFLSADFAAFQDVFDFVDETFEKTVRPIADRIAARTLVPSL